METLTRILENIDEIVWGMPLIILIMAAGIFLTIRLRGLQIRHLPKALKYMVKNEDEGYDSLDEDDNIMFIGKLKK